MKKILVIEDESALQKMIEDVLSKDCYKIIPALNGKIGLELAEKEKPDLILLDLIMPQINGFEVLEGLKKNVTTKNIPVIVLTNLESMQDINRAIELGAKSYLVKANYELSEIAEKVKQALGD